MPVSCLGLAPFHGADYSEQEQEQEKMGAVRLVGCLFGWQVALARGPAEKTVPLAA